ncbi:hypothetical protein ACLOJK_018377 [Asimina triloba]
MSLNTSPTTINNNPFLLYLRNLNSPLRIEPRVGSPEPSLARTRPSLFLSTL